MRGQGGGEQSHAIPLQWLLLRPVIQYIIYAYNYTTSLFGVTFVMDPPIDDNLARLLHSLNVAVASDFPSGYPPSDDA